MQAAVVGIDIGGTKVAVGVAPWEGGEPWRTARLETAALPPGEEALDRIAAAARELVAAAGLPWQAVRGAGVGSPGPFRGGRRLYRPANLPGWDGLDLEAGFQARLGCPVRVENDANAAAWAEWRQGAGQGSRSLVFVTVSTGIGAGMVLDGRLYEGAEGNAGEIGHWVLDPKGPLCHCGRRGCLETLASGTALARMAADRRAGSPYLQAVERPTARE
ncbi:MAG: ROK family protein, partial [Firmicutes bacterium]|nr:ROK family protein [Bacillota bacterium]